MRGRARIRRLVRRALSVAGLLVVATTFMGPLTYDERAHAALDNASRVFGFWGNPLLGFDVTMPRQNVFSLVRDLDKTIEVQDRARLYRSRALGLITFISRGEIHTVQDAVRWFGVSLTSHQAQSLGLCRSLDSIREGEAITIPPDPFEQGVASWYGPGFHGRLAASGEVYNMNDRTAAHKTLPLQTLVRVVHQRTGQSVIVRINDRGPYVGGRIIDMSRRAMDLLGGTDLALVYLERIDPRALDQVCP